MCWAEFSSVRALCALGMEGVSQCKVQMWRIHVIVKRFILTDSSNGASVSLLQLTTGYDGAVMSEGADLCWSSTKQTLHDF